MKDKASLVAVIIINYNGRNIITDALDSVYASDYKPLRCIVVDNHSTDGSVELIRSRYPLVHLIVNQRNAGFAAACNQGIAEAARNGADLILFLNSDAAVDSKAVGVLVDFLTEHPHAAAAAPYILYADRREVIWYGGGVVRLWRGWIAHRRIRQALPDPLPRPELTDYLTGCLFLTRLPLIRDAGGFDEGFGLYSEDVDLSLRLRRRGWELWVTPQARGYHQVSATAGGEMSPFKGYHRGRSATLLARRHARLWEWPTLAAGGLLGGALGSLKLVAAGKASTAAAVWAGIYDGLFRARKGLRFPLKD